MATYKCAWPLWQAVSSHLGSCSGKCPEFYHMWEVREVREVHASRQAGQQGSGKLSSPPAAPRR
jgi:hypothetical protein